MGNRSNLGTDALTDPGRPGDPDHDPYDSVYAFVRSVPVGKVVTYGQVAGSLDDVSLTARQVGAAMRRAPTDVPWHRVVGAGGYLPIGKQSPEAARLQRQLLVQEGVPFREPTDRVLMSCAQWMVGMGQ